MNIDIDYKASISLIEQMLQDLPEELQAEEQKFLKSTGTAIKKNVVQLLHDSDVEERLEGEPKNYDGSRPYVHLKDDVKFTVKKSKQGDYYVSVKGGKYTGYKWGPLNDGHIARDGHTFVPGIKFMDRALQASQGDIEAELDKLLKAVVG